MVYLLVSGIEERTIYYYFVFSLLQFTSYYSDSTACLFTTEITRLISPLRCHEDISSLATPVRSLGFGSLARHLPTKLLCPLANWRVSGLGLAESGGQGVP